MILHDMTCKHAPPRSYGDCFRASIATVLQTPRVEDVPHFLDAGDLDNWWNNFVAWCAERGLEPYWASAERFTPPGYYILTGMSPRHEGVCHAVVARDRVVIHDPHPSRAGIKAPHADVVCLYLAHAGFYDTWRKMLCANQS